LRNAYQCSDTSSASAFKKKQLVRAIDLEDDFYGKILDEKKDFERAVILVT
jgi:hypothetical protein